MKRRTCASGRGGRRGAVQYRYRCGTRDAGIIKPADTSPRSDAVTPCVAVGTMGGSGLPRLLDDQRSAYWPRCEDSSSGNPQARCKACHGQSKGSVTQLSQKTRQVAHMVLQCEVSAPLSHTRTLSRPVAHSLLTRLACPLSLLAFPRVSCRTQQAPSANASCEISLPSSKNLKYNQKLPKRDVSRGILGPCTRLVHIALPLSQSAITTAPRDLPVLARVLT